jgi:hypothetical protein
LHAFTRSVWKSDGAALINLVKALSLQVSQLLFSSLLLLGCKLFAAELGKVLVIIRVRVSSIFDVGSGLVDSILEKAFLGHWVDIDSLIVDKIGDRAELAHQPWRSNGLDNLSLFLVAFANVFLVVVFVPVVVDTAGQFGLKKGHDTQKHLGRYLLIDLHVVFVVDPLLVPKHVGNKE